MAVTLRRTVWSSTMWMHLAACSRQAPVQMTTIQTLKYSGNNLSPHRSDGTAHYSRHKSTYSVLPEDYNCKVELALTSDRRTIVCHHPSVEIPYEHTQPIPRPDPVNNKEETHDQVLKSRLEVKELKNSMGPTYEELSKMFYTTKHRWYPVGQYQRRRKKLNPPKER